jgi:hypothetical protein
MVRRALTWWQPSQRALYGCVVALVLASLNPINNGRGRALFLCALAFCLATGVLWSWSRPRVRVVVLLVLALELLLLCLPAREADTVRLRDRYVDCLAGYEGARYVWGGEGILGIDCSGLPRRALRDAMWREGLRSLNAGLLRESIVQWWRDASALALSQGCRGYALPLGTHGTIRGMSYDGLMAGDLAITDSGCHVICYLGSGRWIQADPDIRRVVILDGRRDPNYWFDIPVHVYRWRVLEEMGGI